MEDTSQYFWHPTIIAAIAAHNAREWSDLAFLLTKARAAPDAPVGMEEGHGGEEVEHWYDMQIDLHDHHDEVRGYVVAAVRLLVQRITERLGAAGAPDPTRAELLQQLVVDAQALNLVLLDDLVENGDGSCVRLDSTYRRYDV